MEVSHNPEVIRANKQAADELRARIVFLESTVKDDTFESFNVIIGYYEKMLNMTAVERSSELYNFMSSYCLLLINSTYDLSIKEIFHHKFQSSLSEKQTLQVFLKEMFDKNIINKNLTNIDHQKIKKVFSIVSPDPIPSDLSTSIEVIRDLIKTRNSIAHGITISSNGHNDLYNALNAIIIYLKWYSEQLDQKLIEVSL